MRNDVVSVCSWCEQRYLLIAVAELTDDSWDPPEAAEAYVDKSIGAEVSL